VSGFYTDFRLRVKGVFFMRNGTGWLGWAVGGEVEGFVDTRVQWLLVMKSKSD